MSNYESCRQMHNTLEKAAPEPKEIVEKMHKIKTVRSIVLVPVPQTPQPPTRNGKYLGLIIEKDEEQIIEIRTDSELESDEIIYMQPPADPVKRVYKPIRE